MATEVELFAHAQLAGKDIVCCYGNQANICHTVLFFLYACQSSGFLQQLISSHCSISGIQNFKNLLVTCQKLKSLSGYNPSPMARTFPLSLMTQFLSNYPLSVSVVCQRWLFPPTPVRIRRGHYDPARHNITLKLWQHCVMSSYFVMMTNMECVMSL